MYFVNTAIKTIEALDFHNHNDWVYSMFFACSTRFWPIFTKTDNTKSSLNLAMPPFSWQMQEQTVNVMQAGNTP